MAHCLPCMHAPICCVSRGWLITACAPFSRRFSFQLGHACISCSRPAGSCSTCLGHTQTVDMQLGSSAVHHSLESQQSMQQLTYPPVFTTHPAGGATGCAGCSSRTAVLALLALCGHPHPLHHPSQGACPTTASCHPAAMTLSCTSSLRAWARSCWCLTCLQQTSRCCAGGWRYAATQQWSLVWCLCASR